MPGQYDIYRLPDGALVCVLQDDLHDTISTRVVAPLIAVSLVGPQSTQLCPLVDFGEEPHVLLTQSLSAIPGRLLGSKVGSLAARRDEIVRALDLLFTGV